MHISATIVFLVLLLPAICVAQNKVRVQVDHTGDDTVGQQFAFTVKEIIRASGGFELTDDFKQARIKLLMVSIDSSGGAEQGSSSAISTAVVYDSLDVPLSGVHLTSLVQNCGRTRIRFCADSLIASVDQEITRLRDRSIVYWRSLYRLQSGSVPSLPAQIPQAAPSLPAQAPQSRPRLKAKTPENPF